MSVTFGQLVIGPPGTGKSTYCHEMSKFLAQVGRKVSIVNLDPANEKCLYKADVDVNELITVEDVMSHKKLGPNGALLYSFEYLEENIQWLLDQLKDIKGTYVMIDCPGQIELYTHHESIRNIINRLKLDGFNLCAVYLLDAHYCNEPGKFVSSLMLTLSTMLHIELPHINVLTKVDLMAKFAEKLPFGLDYYTDVLDLKYILEYLEEECGSTRMKFHKFNEALSDLIENYGLVSFLPLNIVDKRMMNNIKNSFDKANGYIYHSKEQRHVQTLLACAVGAQTENERIGLDRDLYTTTDYQDTNEP
ncbi:GPN-loop GTPase 2 [Cimex lectularius]|uniref:GPN-loop GTPase 2 n=1 Tax=Cimex lectularius TaxID=79782 RepID=A0A8I6RC11_CIMLE|nr:GPN-loop GTPase 2 [Cimex lectularius]